MTRLDDSPVPDYANRLRLDDRRFVVIGAGSGHRPPDRARARGERRPPPVRRRRPGAWPTTSRARSAGRRGRATPPSARTWSACSTTRSSALGGVDGLVDIVGISRFIDTLDLTDEDWDWHFDMSIRHAFLAMQYGAKAMADHGGRHGVRGVGVGHHVGAPPRRVRRGQGRAHVAGAHRRGGVRPARDPGERGRAGCGVDAARVGLPRRRRTRAQQRELAVAARRAAPRTSRRGCCSWRRTSRRT